MLKLTAMVYDNSDENDEQDDSAQEPVRPKLNKLRATALAWLGRQEYSIAKFTKKLKDNDASIEQIDTIVAEFCQHNWLSEQRYCEGFVRSRINKGQGKIRIKNDGRGHQLDSDILAQAIDTQEVDWFELALSTYQRRYGKNPIANIHAKEHVKEKAKRLRFMQYRGFTMDQISYAIDETGDSE